MLESLGPIIGLAAFIIIVIISKNVIEEGLKISGTSAWVLAVCVAALAIDGIMQPANGETKEREITPFILIIYGSYGLACLLAMLLGLLLRNPNRRERFWRWFAKGKFYNDDRMKR